jgi:serine protease Do/serine protease DegQ
MSLRLILAAASLAASLTAATTTYAALPSNGATDSPMPSLAPMVKRASPSVVNIATRGTVKEKQGQRNPLLDDPFFRRFFENPPDSKPRERQFQSAGSGVIVDAANGYIITNYHVVENASEITITLLDDRTFTAKVVGSDEGADIALLQAKQPNLVAMPMGDSARLEVGDFVVAIGNPFGLQHTVTAGIVSALGRTGISNPEGYEDFIQTDASINPGNSGGALVNLRGELVGINSAILSGNGGNIGIGFAIPVNMVKGVMDQLIKYGEVKRGMLGVSIYPVSPEIAKEYGLAESSGALVTAVAPGSAAERAGIKTGDIITSINGVMMKRPGEVRNTIGMLRVGDKVDIGLLRDGKPQKITALIMERSEAETANAADINQGLEGAELADAPNGSGVLVRSVQEGSPAAAAGIRANDLIVGVGRTPVTGTKGFREAAKSANVLVLNIRRGSLVLLIPIR